MNFAPKSKTEWLRVLVLPFRVYVVAMFLGIKVLALFISFRRKYGFPYETCGLSIGLILLAYLLSFFVFVSYAVYCFRRRDTPRGITSFLFAALALILAYVLCPPLAVS